MIDVVLGLRETMVGYLRCERDAGDTGKRIMLIGGFAEREVKKANREIRNQTVRMTDLQKAEHLTKKYEELYADMKRLERENTKNKKQRDQLQKDKDKHHNELSKTTTMKDKLEKLCRELQRDNNRLKVDISFLLGQLWTLVEIRAATIGQSDALSLAPPIEGSSKCLPSLAL